MGTHTIGPMHDVVNRLGICDGVDEDDCLGLWEVAWRDGAFIALHTSRVIEVELYMNCQKKNIYNIIIIAIRISIKST